MEEIRLDLLTCICENLFIADFIGLVIGILCLLKLLIIYVTKLRMEHEWLLYLLVVWQLALSLVWNPKQGAESIPGQISSGEICSLRSTSCGYDTHLFGGSTGREGAALQIGGSIGNWLGVRLKFEQKDITIMTMWNGNFCSSSGTPLAATVFSMEVISIGIMHYSVITVK